MPEKTVFSPQKTSSWKWQIGLAVFLFLVVTMAGGAMGYWANVQETPNPKATEALMEVLVAVQEQFYLGKQALEAQRYEDAKAHFEYVIKADPNFPEAQEKLAETLTGLYAEPSPTPTLNLQITPTVTPTPIIPNQVDLLYQAQHLVKNKEWNVAIEKLQTLRSFHPQYQSTEVDSLLFTSLYYRGMEHIAAGDLAGGLYDLERAARFSVLDKEAQDQKRWASFYLAGTSYWGLDWKKAAYYFGLIVEEAPDFQDASGVTVQQRYREAAKKYAELSAEKSAWCEAERYFRIALDYGAEDALTEKLNKAVEMCKKLQELQEEGE